MIFVFLQNESLYHLLSIHASDRSCSYPKLIFWVQLCRKKTLRNLPIFSTYWGDIRPLKNKVAKNEKGKNTRVFVFQKYGKIWNVSLNHFNQSTQILNLYNRRAVLPSFWLNQLTCFKFLTRSFTNAYFLLCFHLDSKAIVSTSS